MSDEYDLPPLPPAWPEGKTTCAKLRCSSPVNSSSDVFFSSDDDRSLDKVQAQPRTRHRGPWFTQAQRDINVQCLPRMPRPPKRKLERQLDSGVWMGSDTSTDDGSDHFLAHPPKRLFRDVTARDAQPQLMPEEIATGLVAMCVENGSEEIDLMWVIVWQIRDGMLTPTRNLGLDRIPPAVLEGLSLIVRTPSTSGETYSSLKPELHVNLACNHLTRLPKELFKVPNMQLLSLRRNRLREIPPAIALLDEVDELNLAQNELHFLPFDFKKHLYSSAPRRTTIHPNPFYVPLTSKGMHAKATSCIRGTAASVSTKKNANGLLRYRTQVRFMDQYGTKVQGPTWPHDIDEETQGLRIDAVDPFVHAVPPSSASAAPSLLEVALRACTQHPQLHELPDYLPYPVPAHISRLLDSAINLHDSGGQKCTTCNRTLIVPRTEWIEWWEVDDYACSMAHPQTTWTSDSSTDSLIPLIRRGCSWNCLPKAQ